jgi:hypothetical protein
MVIATSYAIRQKTLPGFCPFLAVQQQSPGVTHIRDCLLAGGFAANPIGVGWFCGAEAPQTPMRMKLTRISHWGAAPNPFVFWFFSVWAKLSCKNHR